MKRFVLWSWLLAKRQLKSVYFLVLLLIIPVAALVMGKFLGEDEGSAVRVAMYAADEGMIAKNTIAGLLENDCYEFYICNSKEALIEDVASDKAQCGYIFNEDIEGRIALGKYSNLISTVAKSNSIVAGIVNETVFSQFFMGFTGAVMTSYVENDEAFANLHPEGMEQLFGAYEQYIVGNRTFRVDFELLGNDGNLENTKTMEASNNFFPLRNFLAVLVFIGGMLGLVSFVEDKNNGVFASMKGKLIRMGRFVYIFVPTMLIGMSMLITLGVTGNIINLSNEIIYMVLYILIITVFCGMLSYILRSQNIAAGLIPLIFIAALFVCPVFVDLSMSVPVIKIIRRLFIPYYYMTMF